MLDTNVVSAFMYIPTDARLRDWLNSIPKQTIWTTAISVYEIRFGIELLPTGRRRSELELAFTRAVDSDLGRRVLPFEDSAAEAAGRISAQLRRSGRSAEIRDSQIAGVCAARNATLATRNIKHFKGLGIALVDPWSDRADPASTESGT